jgi:hypothetical protein
MPSKRRGCGSNSGVNAAPRQERKRRVLTLQRSRVSEITAFTGRLCAATETGSLPDLFPRFGLPTELPRG